MLARALTATLTLSGAVLPACAGPARPATPTRVAVATAVASASTDIPTSPCTLKGGHSWLGFAASSRFVYTSDGSAVFVTELATAKPVARVPFDLLAEQASQSSVTVGATTADAITLVGHGGEGKRSMAETRSVPDGLLMSIEPFDDGIDTPQGRARLEVVIDPSSHEPFGARVLVEGPTERRSIDLRSSFAGQHYLALEHVGLVGDALVIRSNGTVQGITVGRLAVVNLRNGRITWAPEPLGSSGDVLLRENRLYAVQGPGTHAFAYEIPSMKRLARFSFPGAITRRLSDLTLGEAPACVALSPDSSVFALSGDGHVHWFDAATGRAEGDVEVSQSGDFSSCLLRFTPDGKRLARATSYGALQLTELASGKTILDRDDGRCLNCSAGPIASGNMEWSGSSLLADNGRFWVVSGAPGALVDLVTGTTTAFPFSRFGGFDPTSQYLVSNEQVFTTSPFRLVGALP
jgi:hypothetical protein